MDEPKKEQSWHLYMVRCADNSLYCGITTDIVRRVKEHNGSKRGARYTSKRRPVVLVYLEFIGTSMVSAMKREYRVKRLHRPKKEALIKSDSNLVPKV